MATTACGVSQSGALAAGQSCRGHLNLKNVTSERGLGRQLKNTDFVWGNADEFLMFPTRSA